MSLVFSTSSAPPILIRRMIVACSLACALFFPGTASSGFAATNDAGVLLGAGRFNRGRFQFSFEATAGQNYPIGVSADLLHWTLLTNIVGTGEALFFSDFDAPKFPERYYQIFPRAFSNMVFIRPGTFTMGSPDSEAGRVSTNEGPETIVTLTRAFWMGKYEVSQAEYIAVTGSNVSWFNYDTKLPAEVVSWEMATNYCYQLTQKELAAGRLQAGYAYRLPTEAEWEYACRAGTTTPFAIGTGTSLSSAQANFDGNFPYGGAPTGVYVQSTTLPGSYAPNPWGLYDMHGNLWEWCQDWFGPYPGGKVTDPTGPATGSERVFRGGGYKSLGKGCRSAVRDSRRAAYKDLWLGFRVVLSAAGP